MATSVNSIAEFVRNSRVDLRLDGWQAVVAIIGMGLCIGSTVVGCRLVSAQTVSE